MTIVKKNMNTFFSNIGKKLASVDISFINRLTPAMSEIQFDNDRISNKRGWQN